MTSKLIATALLGALLPALPARAADALGKETIIDARPSGLRWSVKMIGPYGQEADLQIVCLFKHKAAGDNYQGAALELNRHMKGLISEVRDTGDYVGELGETLLIVPPASTIPARRLMIIGLGEERDLSLDCLRLVGRIAAREAVRLQAQHVAWAPVIRDEGNTTIDVGVGDRAFAEQFCQAYAAEKRLQARGAAAPFSIADVVIEAGPTYFAGAVREVGAGLTALGGSQ